MAIWNERIKMLRKERGITLAEVADRLHVTEATAQRYESGNIKNIPYDHICTYAEILNCSPSYIMGWEKVTEKQPTHEDLKTLIARNGKEMSIEEKLELIKMLSEL